MGGARTVPDVEFDDDPARIDLDAVWGFLGHHAYWGRWRTRADVERQVAGAWRVVGCYADGEQIGFARVVSDGVSLAYLADVYVRASHRGRGLGRRLVAATVDDGPGQDFRWLLHTADAHGLYLGFGFAGPDVTLLERPGRQVPSGSGWQSRVDAVWAGARDREEDDVLAEILALVEQRPDDDPVARFERASGYDFAGREGEAEPHYRAALAGGLDPARRARAVVQLASTVRNLGRPDEALDLLDDEVALTGQRDAATAFRALAQADLGRDRDAVVGLLHALAAHLPSYAGAVRHYAGALAPEVALHAVTDDAVLDRLVGAALADADPDDVTPPLGPGWTPARLDWLRTHHRDRTDGLVGPHREIAWAVVRDGHVRGGARLRALGDGRYETGLWLVRGARGSGVGRAVLAAVLDLAGLLGAREVVADTVAANSAALALLRRAGFGVEQVDGDAVRARLVLIGRDGRSGSANPTHR